MSTLASKTITSRSNIIKIISKIVRQSPNSTYCPQYNRKQGRSTRYGAISLAQSAYIQRNGNFSNYVAATHDYSVATKAILLSPVTTPQTQHGAATHYTHTSITITKLYVLLLNNYHNLVYTTRSSQPLPMIFSTCIINIIAFSISLNSTQRSLVKWSRYHIIL